MAGSKTILVTGVTGFWGERVATQLIADKENHVIGLDTEKPKVDIKNLDFIQADIRNPLLVDLLKTEQVDTVCHLAMIESQQPSENSFENNVMGTAKVLGACAAASVRKIVLKSSTIVYGACPDNSFYLPEEAPLKGSRSVGMIRDLVEVEAFCNGFRRQVPGIILTILRFGHIVGPTVDTPMTRFLKEPWTPILWGFNPMMQVIHENDVTAALAHVVENDLPGVFNVAAEDHMPLDRLVALAGKFALPVFHLFVYWGTNLANSLGVRPNRYIPFDLDYIRYPYLGDLARMREEMGFTPRYTAEETLREFAGHQRMSPYQKEGTSMEYDIDRLRDTIERRKRTSQRNGGASDLGGMKEDEEEGVQHE